MPEFIGSNSDEVKFEGVVEAEGKTVTIRAIENRRGKAIRIKEMQGRDRVVILPLSGVKALQVELANAVRALG